MSLHPRLASKVQNPRTSHGHSLIPISLILYPSSLPPPSEFTTPRRLCAALRRGGTRALRQHCGGTGGAAARAPSILRNKRPALDSPCHVARFRPWSPLLARRARAVHALAPSLVTRTAGNPAQPIAPLRPPARLRRSHDFVDTLPFEPRPARRSAPTPIGAACASICFRQRATVLCRYPLYTPSCWAVSLLGPDRGVCLRPQLTRVRRLPR